MFSSASYMKPHDAHFTEAVMGWIITPPIYILKA